MEDREFRVTYKKLIHALEPDESSDESILQSVLSKVHNPDPPDLKRQAEEF